MGRYTGKTCRLVVMLSMTFGFFIVEIVFGYITNSMALIADSFHMLSDVLALIIAFCCMKISKKKSSKNTFGWVRAEVLGALVNAVFLMALCFSIVVEALKRLVEPEDIEKPVNILIVGALGLLINIIGIVMFHGHASVHGHSHARPVPLDLPAEEDEEMDEETEKLSPVITRSHNISIVDDLVVDSPKTPTDYGDASSPADKKLIQKTKNGKQSTQKPSGTTANQLNMHGVFLHILGDAFGSIIVIVNAIICIFIDNDKVKKYLDPSLSLAIAVIITFTTVPLLKESALILLQTVPTHINIQETKAKLLKSIDGVLAVHEFHVWRLAGNKIIATAHIRCRNLDDYMKIAEKVKEFFHLEGIHSTTIQPEFGELDTMSAPHQDVDECVLECPKNAECAPSTCCGPKQTSTTPNAGAGGVADRSFELPSYSELVSTGAVDSNYRTDAIPSMNAAHRPTSYELRRRLSKSEDNLTSDLNALRYTTSTPIKQQTFLTNNKTTDVVDDQTRTDLGVIEDVSFSKQAQKITKQTDFPTPGLKNDQNIV